mmetsp:Transcript_27680/g.77561  ORF Transcript_27680/g.77561 Transcript_27680/m.77561 type:complete len:205 (+) Transcript_27680:176-790(+)
MSSSSSRRSKTESTISITLSWFLFAADSRRSYSCCGIPISSSSAAILLLRRAAALPLAAVMVRRSLCVRTSTRIDVEEAGAAVGAGALVPSSPVRSLLSLRGMILLGGGGEPFPKLLLLLPLFILVESSVAFGACVVFHFVSSTICCACVMLAAVACCRRAKEDRNCRRLQRFSSGRSLVLATSRLPCVRQIQPSNPTVQPPTS